MLASPSTVSRLARGEQGRIVGGADVYMSDFGEMEIVPHYLMVGADVVYGINHDYAAVAYLDGVTRNPLVKTWRQRQGTSDP